MRTVLAAILLMSPVLCRAAALPAQFESSVINSAGTVILKSAPAYNADQQGKGEAVAQAALALGIPVDKPVAVQWPGGGELWTMKDIGAVKLDSWSDKALPLGPNSQKGGRWFGFFGIQSMGGGDFPSSSMNLRVGSTLFKNQYDLAYTYDYYKPAESETYRASMGLVARKLMPLSPHGGWNIGAQVSSINDYGVHKGALSLVTGLNIYLPRGSFDITLNLQDKGVFGILAGYTVYITR